MTFKKLSLVSVLFVCQFALAQNDSIRTLEVVEISDVQLKNYSNSQSVQKLNDSIINKNQSSLTSLLNYNTVIYFKENGLGMVSSPSFRGTTAQQTAVIWNGININSQLNGQTDFNTLTTRNFDNITVRAGGGSSIYGSSAIGGSIHLNNNLSFRNHFDNQVRLSYGSFNTFGGHYKIDVSDGKFAVQASISRNSSDNDYDYLDTDKKNENGQFYNTSINVVAGYKLNDSNILKIYSQVFDSERHFSGSLGFVSKTKYQDVNTRNMLEWTGLYSKFTSKFKVAFISENYKYFEDAEGTFFTHGKTESAIAKYDLAFNLNEEISVNSIFEYNRTKGFGSDIQEEVREIGSGTLLFKLLVSDAFLYELSVRKELTNNYKSPVLFSLGTNLKVTSFYNLKFNASRNFRIPTFNDLYWRGSGNPELNPETSYQAEIGNDFTFENFTFSATGYYIKIDNMLRWSPESGSLWTPNNVAKVKTYGVEGYLNWNKNFGKNNFDFNASYAYTISNDEKLDKRLIYVPYHKLTSSASYSFGDFTAYYQYLFNGEVFTSSDNAYTLDGYSVSNIGINYTFFKSVDIGFEALNIYNENYQSTLNRPLPGRNFNMNLTFKF
ncbi:TonB-dependent receptor [Flavobacterium macacae]|uniref:TonB-dependent receptor n=1 Tax=Flavobacterium macacae TaxID=2488993 RepID=A0A3P3WDP3_9FLAO|nr:TonB-dependent receptor [Flavobacterium macacae]RRJ92487.1 TonB-dependent receptor [Flavobacterium macacae]